VLDVTFREDDSRVRRDNASDKKGIKAKRYKAALQPEYAQKVLDGIF